jgi:hypothetical protein
VVSLWHSLGGLAVLLVIAKQNRGCKQVFRDTEGLYVVVPLHVRIRPILMSLWDKRKA